MRNAPSKKNVTASPNNPRPTDCESSTISLVQEKIKTMEEQHRTLTQKVEGVTSELNTVKATCNSPIRDPVQVNKSVCTGTQTDDCELTCLKIELENKTQEIDSLHIKIKILERHTHPTSGSNQNPNIHPPRVHSGTEFTCHLIGDSHVRGLLEKLSPLLPSGCTVQSTFQPGAGYHEMAKIHNQSPHLVKPDAKDSVIIMCGTNDVGSTQWELIQKGLHNLINKFQHCESLCILGIPFRFCNKKMNFHITRLNTKIKNYVLSNNVSFLDPNKWLKPKNYAFDGLHLNNEGKTKLSLRLKKCIF